MTDDDHVALEGQRLHTVGQIVATLATALVGSVGGSLPVVAATTAAIWIHPPTVVRLWCAIRLPSLESVGNT